MKLLNVLTRNQAPCEAHQWISTINSGLRRDVCEVCGMITMSSVETAISSTGSLQLLTQG
jgi:hypothetical protein